MYFSAVPSIIQRLFPQVLWRMPKGGKSIYLSFDDGPEPSITPEVLELLAEFDAKATFFCSGEQVEKHPHIAKDIQTQGHTLANHGYRHLDGWKTRRQAYIENVLKGNELIQSQLFRPPYGRITFRQLKSLKKQFQLVMWDVFSGDYDHKLSVEKCVAQVIKNSQPGSIIVFHDNTQAAPRLLPILREVLTHFTKEGYLLKAL
jgi:peptidoglycan/xylan/chitin deacetylase (PgdA/CDA1 family)